MTERPPRFAIAIDTKDMPEDELRKVIVFVSSNKLFMDWHSPFDGFFFVESDHDLKEISDNIGDYFGSKRRIFVTELGKDKSRGFLATQTWDWLGRHDDNKNTNASSS
jgi:hypothetical protein